MPIKWPPWGGGGGGNDNIRRVDMVCRAYTWYSVEFVRARARACAGVRAYVACAACLACARRAWRERLPPETPQMRGGPQDRPGSLLKMRFFSTEIRRSWVGSRFLGFLTKTEPSPVSGFQVFHGFQGFSEFFNVFVAIFQCCSRCFRVVKPRF